jgi:hypothetical protein
VLGLPSEKKEALQKYDHRFHKAKPRLEHAPITLYTSSGVDQMTPFPSWYLERLEKMAEFTMHVTKPDGHILQIGDNDSGRFLKLQPVYRRMKTSDALNTYVNLSDYKAELPNDEYWIEDLCDHRHLISAVQGIFERQDFTAFADGTRYEINLIKQLIEGVYIPSRYKQEIPFADNPDQSVSEQVTLYSCPNFGLYIYRSKRLHLAVRCGPNGQNGYGGHAHNDQLSIELSVDGLPIIVDSGSYLYTPVPEKRNLFRSTAMHNTLLVAGKEQNAWHEGPSGLFRMSNQAQAHIIQVNGSKFAGEHHGFGFTHRRTIEVFENRIKGLDECGIKREKSILFHLAPEVRADLTNENGSITLHVDKIKTIVKANHGKWTIQETFYSPAYGMLQKSLLLKLQSLAESTQWSIEII